MNEQLIQLLWAFATEKQYIGNKGPLCVALVVTEHARTKGLPLRQQELITGGGGQVSGLGKAAVQAILGRYGISTVLAREGGRTSRGSPSKMQEYVNFLNELHAMGEVDLDAVENFWIGRVRDFFAAKPFLISWDASLSLRNVVRDVIAQAEKRQKESTGTNYAGAVMQHLIGAKLDCALGRGRFEHHSFSTSDEQSGRSGDFLIGDVGIHVTTAPGEAVIERCRENLSHSLRPILVTVARRVAMAEGLSENAKLADRIDIFEFEQFIALNLYELGQFGAAGRQTAVAEVVNRYNEIIDQVETDPSLRIELRS